MNSLKSQQLVLLVVMIGALSFAGLVCLAEHSTPASVVLMTEASFGGRELSRAGRSSHDKDNSGKEEKQKQQDDQQQFDLTTLLEIGGNPLGSAVKFALPNTLQGLNSDFTNSYQMLGGNAQSQFKNLQSNFNSAKNSANNQYDKLSNNLMGTYSSAEDNLRQYYSMLQNPQQFCQNLALQGQQALNLAQQQANQAMLMPDNYYNRFQQSQLMQQQLQPSLSQATQLGNSFLKSFGFGK